jgi:hypothetical protein
VRIKNDCAKTPVGLLWQARRALGWINPADLAGIDHVWLMDEIRQAALGGSEELRRLESEGQRLAGFYLRRSGDAPPVVALVVARHYEVLPFAYRLTPAAAVMLAHTLAHEVAHHLIATRGYVFDPGERLRGEEFEEEFANRYAVEVTKRMRRRWYYRLGLWLLKDLAEWHYIFGVLDWRDRRYQGAAEHWRKSFWLYPENPEIPYWYHRAKDMAAPEAAARPEAGEHATGQAV